MLCFYNLNSRSALPCAMRSLSAFAHVADYDLQFGKAVENAAEDEANDVNRSYDVPAPARAGEHLRYEWCKAAV